MNILAANEIEKQEVQLIESAHFKEGAISPHLAKATDETLVRTLLAHYTHREYVRGDVLQTRQRNVCEKGLRHENAAPYTITIKGGIRVNYRRQDFCSCGE